MTIGFNTARLRALTFLRKIILSEYKRRFNLAYAPDQTILGRKIHSPLPILTLEERKRKEMYNEVEGT